MPNFKYETSKSVTCDEWVLVELDTPITNLDRITDINVLGNSATNLTTQYRYSRDGSTWSEWKTWNAWDVPQSEFTWFGFRFKSETSWNFEGFDLTWTGGELLSETCNVNLFVYDEGGILAPCDTSQYTYNAGFGYVKIWEQMSKAVFDKYGWPIIYFKCDPIKESRDVVFKEWSLLEVKECKQIKAIVPDNDFGSGEYQFTEFDIDFSDDLTIELSKEMFWAAFGNYEQPAEKDFLYFPIERRMYRINGVQQSKDLMRQSYWWKVNLIKWNESDSIIKSDEIQSSIDDLTLNFKDVGFEDERANEEIDLVIEQQYTSRPVGINDKVRESVDIQWESGSGIVQENLSNYFTVFSKYQYNLSNEGATATELITYQHTVDATSDFSVMYWHLGTTRPIEFQNKWLTLFGGEMTVDYLADDTNITKIRIAGREHDVTIPLGNWYAYYIGVNRVDDTLTLRVWEREDVSKKTTKMSIFFEQICPLPTTGIPDTWKPSILANGDKLTSVRFLKYPVVLENQSTLFNKLIFPDASGAYIIDDAWPIVYMDKMSPR